MSTLFGQHSSGAPVHQITLRNRHLTVTLLTLGAALQDVRLRDVDHGLTLGTPDLAAYQAGMQYSGTLIGPVANRIKGARAQIDGQDFTFDRNFLDQHTLHSGAAATHSKIWDLIEHSASHAIFSIRLPSDQGGFPGNRQITALYALNSSALSLNITATTDAPTLLNMCNHSYWNLGPNPTTRGHNLRVMADAFLPTELPSTLPLGTIAPVAGTRFDYREGRNIASGDEGLIDTNFCLSDTRQPLRDVAVLTGPTGVQMTMATTEPGLQIFDGHGLDLPGISDMDGHQITAYAGLAMEAQFWPDAPNNTTFPGITLRPDDPWKQITQWTFSAG